MKMMAMMNISKKKMMAEFRSLNAATLCNDKCINKENEGWPGPWRHHTLSWLLLEVEMLIYVSKSKKKIKEKKLTGSLAPPHFVLSLQESIPSAAFAWVEIVLLRLFHNEFAMFWSVFHHHFQDSSSVCLRVCLFAMKFRFKFKLNQIKRFILSRFTSAVLQVPTACLQAFFSFRASSLSAFGLHF